MPQAPQANPTRGFDPPLMGLRSIPVCEPVEDTFMHCLLCRLVACRRGGPCLGCHLDYAVQFMAGFLMTSPSEFRLVDTAIAFVDCLMVIVFGIWRLRFSPCPFLPFGYQTRFDSEHSHHCLRLGHKYLHPGILVLLGLLHITLLSVTCLRAAVQFGRLGHFMLSTIAQFLSL
jgi:hypothetical protein